MNSIVLKRIGASRYGLSSYTETKCTEEPNGYPFNATNHRSNHLLEFPFNNTAIDGKVSSIKITFSQYPGELANVGAIAEIGITNGESINQRTY